VETVAELGIISKFPSISNNVNLHVNTWENLKCAWEKNGFYSCNVKIIGFNEIYKVSVSVYIVSGAESRIQ
jgi:hypothetical protein